MRFELRQDEKRPGALILSRNFPNRALPLLGLWTERLVRASREVVDPVVVAPVGYVPPGLPLRDFSRFRSIPRSTERGGIPVHHPRVPALPGYLLHRFDARLAYPFVRAVVDRIVERQRISVIHAHFIFPEGVIASQLGERYGLPVVTTEHAMWRPWLERHGSVRRQVLAALPGIDRISVVSQALGRTVRDIAGADTVIELLPNMVEEEVFTLGESEEGRDRSRVTFVGVVRQVKGLDVLVEALPRLIRKRPRAHLVVVGDPFFRRYRKDQEGVQALIRSLDLESRVTFAGPASPQEVAEHMRRSAVVVVPSRRESFPTVIPEALATGTPVVATRCGGPEEAVEDRVGRLVDVEDREGLADALAHVLSSPQDFSPQVLREYAVSRWGRAATVRRLRRIYGAAIPDLPEE